MSATSPFAALARQSAAGGKEQPPEPKAPDGQGTTAEQTHGLRAAMRRGAYATHASLRDDKGGVRIGHIENLPPAPGEPTDTTAKASAEPVTPVKTPKREAKRRANPAAALADGSRGPAARSYVAAAVPEGRTPSPFDRLVEQGARPEVKRARADMHALNMLTVLASAVLYRQKGDLGLQGRADLLRDLLRDAQILSRSLLRTASEDAGSPPKWLVAESLSLAAEIVAENYRNGLVDFGQPDQIDILNQVLDQQDFQQAVEDLQARAYVEATREDIAAARLRISTATAAGRLLMVVRNARSEDGAAIAFEGETDQTVLGKLLDLMWEIAQMAPVMIEDLDTATAYMQSAVKRVTEMLCSTYERVARRSQSLDQCISGLRAGVATHFQFIEGAALAMFEEDSSHEKGQNQQERRG